MLGCYLARAPGDFHCCPGHLQLATQLSDRPFRLYGEFSANSERDAWCASLLVFESNHIPTGVPHLDHNDHLFDKLPWNAGDTFEVPNHHDRCAFLFFKEKPLSYGAIYKDGPEEIKWKGNGNKQVIEHKGADLIIEGVSLRFSGVIPVKIKSIQQGWWMLTHFLYQDHSLYCMSYERKSPRDTEDKDRGSDEEEEADGKDDDDKTNAKEAEKDPWISNPKGARTRITRPRNMSSFGVCFLTTVSFFKTPLTFPSLCFRVLVVSLIPILQIYLLPGLMMESLFYRGVEKFNKYLHLPYTMGLLVRIRIFSPSINSVGLESVNS